MSSYTRKGNSYFIVAVNGRTSKSPLPHPKIRDARAEAERLAKCFPQSNVFVYAACFKVNVSSDGKIVKSYLRYKKPPVVKEVTR